MAPIQVYKVYTENTGNNDKLVTSQIPQLGERLFTKAREVFIMPVVAPWQGRSQNLE